MLALLCAPLTPVGASEVPSARTPACTDPAPAYAYLSSLRRGLGLAALEPSAALARAAERHARYLERNRPAGGPGGAVDGHAEVAGRPGFTGATPDARALQAGYPHEAVLENVYTGAGDVRAAVDGLMSGIYHRFGFLDPLMDQLGVGACGGSHVFAMGRADLERLCTDPPGDALYVAPVPIACAGGVALDASYMGRFCAAPPEAALLREAGEFVKPCGEGVRVARRWWEAFCKDPPPAALHRQGSLYATPCPALPSRRVGADYLERLRRERLARAPRHVGWPEERLGPVHPAFANERPDPMPGHRETGYPVSVELNPALVARVAVEAFKLFRVLPGGGEEPVAPTRLLDQASDPNRRLSAHQFALFPLQRLAWGARYRVEVRARLDGRAEVLSWSFATRDLGMAVHRVGTGAARIRYATGQPLALDLSGAGGLDSGLGEVRAWAQGQVPVRLEAIDRSTLQVEVGAATCAPVRIERGARPLAELNAADCSP